MLVDEILASLNAHAQRPTGAPPLPGSPQDVNPLDLTSIIGAMAQQGGQQPPSMPFSLAGPTPATNPAQTGGGYMGVGSSLAGNIPSPTPSGGYMGVGSGLANNLPQAKLPPPETEPSAPSGIATGSLPSASISQPDASPDFAPTFAQRLSQAGTALQGKTSIDFESDVETKNATYGALVRKGIDPATAKAMVLNPAMLQAALPAIFNPTKNLTDDQRGYEMARGQGYGGSFLDYLTTLKRAGKPETFVNTDMRAENSESKGRGEGLAKRLNSIAEDGIEAGKDMVTLQRLSQLTSNVDPGTKTALFEELRDATGIALDPNTDNVQAFKAAASYLAPRMRVPGSGASSDRDVSLFMKALPSLIGTPEGNQTVIETLGGMAQLRQRRADIAAQWQRGEISAADADKAMTALPDPFKSFKERTPSATGTQARDLPVLTPEQAAKAPAGTRFKDVNGKVRMKQ